jgi:adenine-specific DNA-methyltransferase
MNETNLSKAKREILKNKINMIRENSDDEIVSILNEIENEIENKIYGLVWEEHSENVDKLMEVKIPVFTEVVGKEVVSNSEDGFNFILEGDNLHSLKLLEKTHRGNVDVVYIDPPYNTGASKWKYNNNYIDGNDIFKHSKWISMMNRRLKIAKSLMKDDGVLICAIDENEIATLKLLLEDLFGSMFQVDVITIVQNPRGIQGDNFSYTNEFALFVYRKSYKVISEKEVEEQDIEWNPLRNWGSESLRTDARNCFYGIRVKDNVIVGFDDVLDESIHPEKNTINKNGETVVYPIDQSGIERNWR